MSKDETTNPLISTHHAIEVSPEPRRGLQVLEWAVRTGRRASLLDDPKRECSARVWGGRLVSEDHYVDPAHPYSVTVGLSWPMDVDLVPADGLEWEG